VIAVFYFDFEWGRGSRFYYNHLASYGIVAGRIINEMDWQRDFQGKNYIQKIHQSLFRYKVANIKLKAISLLIWFYRIK